MIFIRPPSAPELRAIEESSCRGRKGWDVLLAGSQAKGIHADDLPQAQNLVIPEWSHLSRKCAAVFTDAYVRRLIQLTPRLKLRADAPPPLSRADCVPAKYRVTVAAAARSFDDSALASLAARQATKIVSSPQIVPTISRQARPVERDPDEMGRAGRAS